MRLYRRSTSYFLTLILVILNVGGVAAAEQIRARDLGIPFEGTPGPLNAITDIAGVEVGQVTIIEGDGSLQVGTGPVRTGVTVIHPRGRESTDPVFAATVRATEEAIVNAMVAAETVIGVSGLQGAELPEDTVREIFRRAASQD